jgi:hypothetical protein
MKNLKKLSREALKNVKGGGTCAAYWPDKNKPTVSQVNNFHSDTISGSGNSVVFYGTSAADAQALAAAKPGGRWCCDSCGSASWY